MSELLNDFLSCWLARRASEVFSRDGPAPVRRAGQSWSGVAFVSADPSLARRANPDATRKLNVL